LCNKEKPANTIRKNIQNTPLVKIIGDFGLNSRNETMAFIH
jgi:hypothetical protein